jgi:hypothetical protein
VRDQIAGISADGGDVVSTDGRLLPWPGPIGQRAYLAADDDSKSHLSRLADEMEAVQLNAAETLLGYAAEMLGDQKVQGLELRFLGHRLCEALRDVLRVAESRGGRLSVFIGPGGAGPDDGMGRDGR